MYFVPKKKKSQPAISAPLKYQFHQPESCSESNHLQEGIEIEGNMIESWKLFRDILFDVQKTKNSQ